MDTGKILLARRKFLGHAAFATGAIWLCPGLLQAAMSGALTTRQIPSTGETLPIIGLGSSTAFSAAARGNGHSELRKVIATMLDNGGTVIDTAPSYGAAEEVSGRIVQDLGATEKVFWATKVNVAARGGGKADPNMALEQIENSFKLAGKSPIDLIQVHNLLDLPTHLGVLKELKQDGKIRYVGVTTTRASRYAELAKVMQSEVLDFIGVNYSIENREPANSILPIARDIGIATLIYGPFERGRLLTRASGYDLPDWAREFGINSWAQFFLKYVAANPAVTCITPGSANHLHTLDNLGAAYGDLPDKATLRRMERTIEALPPA